MTDLAPALPDQDPDDLPVDQLKVHSLGEDGDVFIVEGTANPRTAETALAVYLERDYLYGLQDIADTIRPLLPEPRVDWYWQDAPNSMREALDVDRLLRAAIPSEDGKSWGGALDLPDHADEPLFRGVYFG